MINPIKARCSTVCIGRVCYGPSLCGQALLWAEFALGRVCYGPRCPVNRLPNNHRALLPGTHHSVTGNSKAFFLNDTG